jgi:hypothetical protein
MTCPEENNAKEPQRSGPAKVTDFTLLRQALKEVPLSQ